MIEVLSLEVHSIGNSMQSTIYTVRYWEVLVTTSGVTRCQLPAKGVLE